ncbi:MAG: Trm112 family protein [Archangium sp.]
MRRTTARRSSRGSCRRSEGRGRAGMQLPDWLQSTLACPRCKGPLIRHPPPLPLPPGEGRGEGSRHPSSPPEITTPEELRCPSCRLAYPIRGGVPELLQDEARPVSSAG